MAQTSKKSNFVFACTLALLFCLNLILKHVTDDLHFR